LSFSDRIADVLLPLIYDLTLPDLTSLIASWGEPAYRAKQIWQGLYQNYWKAPDEFTTLPKPIRQQLNQALRFEALTPTRYLESSDGQTRKMLFRLHDGQQIEAVLMKYGDPAIEVSAGRVVGGSRYIPSEPLDQRRRIETKRKRRTLCISTQVGCAMGCVFCATGQMGFHRHLSSGEIVAQVMYYARLLHEGGEHVTNVVVMGMGEPFHNYEQTLAAIDRLNDPDGYNLGARRFTISSVGLAPMIRRFSNEKRQVNLAISLHAAEDGLRSSMLPINKKYDLDQVLTACREYVEKTGRRITFEWALINKINDTPEQARILAGKLKGLLCHVNAIPLNPTTGYSGQATNPQRAATFRSELERAGIPCTIRVRRGIDIQAGCGQLAVG
jgi:23S rRNA (adenine2503-C2)-methyltransferase